MFIPENTSSAQCLEPADQGAWFWFRLILEVGPQMQRNSDINWIKNLEEWGEISVLLAADFWEAVRWFWCFWFVDCVLVMSVPHFLITKHVIKCSVYSWISSNKRIKYLQENLGFKTLCKHSWLQSLYKKVGKEALCNGYCGSIPSILEQLQPFQLDKFFKFFKFFDMFYLFLFFDMF